MEEIHITVSSKTLNNLKGNDKKKGQAIEEVVYLTLEHFGHNVVKCKSKLFQLTVGDLVVIKNNELFKTIECKSSHTFHNGGIGIPKLMLDYEYYERGSYFTKPYNQSTTNNNLGWLQSSNSTTIIAYNIDNSMLYVIDNFNILKPCILEEARLFKANKYPLTQVCNGYKLNDYIEICKVKRDKYKDSIGLSLMLSKEAINYYGASLKTYNIIFD